MSPKQLYLYNLSALYILSHLKNYLIGHQKDSFYKYLVFSENNKLMAELTKLDTNISITEHSHLGSCLHVLIWGSIYENLTVMTTIYIAVKTYNNI